MPEIFLHQSWTILHMENRHWQKLAEKKSRHNQKSHGMYWNIIVYPFNCLSWSILTQRYEKYWYSVIDSRWCVRVFLFFVFFLFCFFFFFFVLFMTYYLCPYTSRYSIIQELLQLLDEFSFSYLFLLFFDRHSQLVCERVKEMNCTWHTQKEHVLPGL